MVDRRRAERKVGVAEALAAASLQVKAYAILDRRARTRAGEIDLVARRGDGVAFVEVKARPCLDSALHAVDARSRARIHRAAELWLAHRRALAGAPAGSRRGRLAA